MTNEELIKYLKEENEYLILEAKKELAEKDKIITILSSESTRLFNPTRKFWNDRLEDKNKKLKDLLYDAITIITKLDNKYMEDNLNFICKAKELIDD